MGSPADPGSALRRWGGPLLILGVALWMLRLTWGTWPDPIVDFGRELYVPWNLLEGQRLYADLAYYNGPLSPHLNALWFALDGVGLASLVHLNLGIAALVLALLHAMLVRVASRTAAALAGVSFAVLFGFGQFTGIGNYNWVCPYSHEMTHGIALSLVAIQCAALHARRGSRVWAAASGAAIGLVLLTKGEVFVAGGGAAALGLGLALWARRATRRDALASGGCWLAAAALPPLLAVLWLDRGLPGGDAWRGALSAWIHTFQARHLAQPFYRAVAGTDAPLTHLGRLLAVAAAWVAALAPAAALAWHAPRSPRLRAALTAATALLWAVAFALAAARLPWEDWLLPLPLWLLLLFAAFARGFFRSAARGRAGADDVLRLALLAFAGLLLAKMILAVRVGHYGFGLAMPGTLLLAAALVAWLPDALSRRGGAGAIFAAPAAVLWAGVLLGHYGIVAHYAAQKTVVVGSGEDAFRADGRGAVLNEAVRRLEPQLAADDTLTTFVDCEMLNYLVRRRSSVPYSKFIPQELALFGESRMLAALRRAPPDFVAVVHADTSEYGARYFGRDYARDIARWIETHYRPLGPPIGAAPMRGQGFGIALLQRRGGQSP